MLRPKCESINKKKQSGLIQRSSRAWICSSWREQFANSQGSSAQISLDLVEINGWTMLISWTFNTFGTTWQRNCQPAPPAAQDLVLTHLSATKIGGFSPFSLPQWFVNQYLWWLIISYSHATSQQKGPRVCELGVDIDGGVTSMTRLCQGSILDKVLLRPQCQTGIQYSKSIHGSWRNKTCCFSPKKGESGQQDNWHTWQIKMGSW